MLPSYNYSDIGLVPRECSEVSSRQSSEITTASTVFLVTLDIPVLVSPMETVVSPLLAAKVRQKGALAILPRQQTLEMDILQARETLKIQKSIGAGEIIAAAVPATSNYLDRITALYYELGVKIFCIDVANGFSKVVGAALSNIGRKDFRENISLIAGNVSSVEGFNYLASFGVEGIRLGVGNGSVCLTPVESGIQRGTATIIRECSQYSSHQRPLLIADGGIKCAGDVVRALALGANLVMSGSFFAGSDECPGEIIKRNDKEYKVYAGQASARVKGNNTHVEGGETLVPLKGSVDNQLKKLVEGLRSGMSYMNKTNLEDLICLPDKNFTLLSQSTQAERGLHAKTRDL